MKNKKIRYKWNYKKFIKNILKLILAIIALQIYGVLLLHICGIDIIL